MIPASAAGALCTLLSVPLRGSAHIKGYAQTWSLSSPSLTITTCPKMPATYDENLRLILAMTVVGTLAPFRSSDKLLSVSNGMVGGEYILCKATTLNMNPRESTSTTTGSTLSPGDSSVYSPELASHLSALVFPMGQNSQPNIYAHGLKAFIEVTINTIASGPLDT